MIQMNLMRWYVDGLYGRVHDEGPGRLILPTLHLLSSLFALHPVRYSCLDGIFEQVLYRLHGLLQWEHFEQQIDCRNVCALGSFCYFKVNTFQKKRPLTF